MTRELPAMPPPPAEIGWLVQLVGAENALTLIEQYAGTRLAVPLSPARSKLRRMIGPDALAALCRAHGGNHLAIPSLKHWRARVYAARGLTMSAIALRLGWNERSVYRAVSDHRPPARHWQMDLNL